MQSPQKDPLRFESEKVTRIRKPKTCPHCGKVFNGNYYHKHIKAIHDKIEWPCERCESRFNREDNLKRHIEFLHEGTRYRCNYCLLLYSDRKELKKHSNNKHPGEEIIYEKIKIKPEAKSHAKTTTKTSYDTCLDCRKTFKRKDNLQRHIAKVHLGELLQCDFCPYKAKEKKSIMKHAKKAHPLDDHDQMTLVKVFDKQFSGRRDQRGPYKVCNRSKNCFNHDAIIERFKLLSNI